MTNKITSYKYWIDLVLLIPILSCRNNSNNNASNFVNTQDSIINEITTEEPIKSIIPKTLLAEDIYKQTIDKVVLILCYKDGIPISQGSGFFIDTNTLVTNYHCIEDAERIDLKIAGKDEVLKGARISKVSSIYDLAIINTKQDFSFVSLDSTGNEMVGSRIYAIGNPRGLEGTISDGIISGKRNNDGVELIQITAPISPGNSGGPVLNEKGDVIGVATFTFKNSQNLNFAMPIKYIDQCIDYNPTLTKKTNTKKSNSDAISLVAYEKERYSHDESFSLKNNTEDDITYVTGVLIYSNMQGEIIDYKLFNQKVIIPVGLSKRITLRAFDNDWVYYKDGDSYDKRFKVEFRLLTYEIDE